MTDGTKTLIGSIAGLAALVAVFAIMSDCSKVVAKVDGTRASECVQSGGKWHQDVPPGPDMSYCDRSAK